MTKTEILAAWEKFCDKQEFSHETYQDGCNYIHELEEGELESFANQSMWKLAERVGY